MGSPPGADPCRACRATWKNRAPSPGPATRPRPVRRGPPRDPVVPRDAGLQGFDRFESIIPIGVVALVIDVILRPGAQPVDQVDGGDWPAAIPADSVKHAVCVHGHIHQRSPRPAAPAVRWDRRTPLRRSMPLSPDALRPAQVPNAIQGHGRLIGQVHVGGGAIVPGSDVKAFSCASKSEAPLPGRIPNQVADWSGGQVEGLGRMASIHERWRLASIIGRSPAPRGWESTRPAASVSACDRTPGQVLPIFVVEDRSGPLRLLRPPPRSSSSGSCQVFQGEPLKILPFGQQFPLSPGWSLR